MTTTSFNRETVRTIGEDFTNALKTVAEKYGIDVARKGITFSNGEFRISFISTVRDRSVENGNLTKKEIVYNQMKTGRNLPDLGFQYLNNGLTMTVVGWNTKARKYPIDLKGSDGKNYKSSVDYIQMKYREYLDGGSR